LELGLSLLSSPLIDGETYTATVDAIVADQWGNWERVTRSWSFSVDATPPFMTGPPVVTPASQVTGGLFEIAVPVSATARHAAIYLGDDLDGWYTWVGATSGNYGAEGTITGTFTVPGVPAAGPYSIWVVLYDEGPWSVSVYVEYAAISAVNYTTWDSVDGSQRDSGIPLVFLEVTDPTWVDLYAEIEVVPGAEGAELNYTFANLGTGDAGPFVAGIFVNPGFVPQLYSVPDYWLDFEGLAAGGEIGGTIPVTGMPRLNAFAFADLTASVGETDEGNNLAQFFYEGVPGTSYPNTTVVPISDHAWSHSSTVVSGGPASIADATVTLNVTHTYTGDLEVWLTSPAGTPVSLAYHRGGWGDNFTGTVFDDLAAISIASGSAPFTGTFRPEQPLGTLAGEGADGTWILSVYDWAGGDVGTIDSWTLTLW
jgi:subtilisin-like proprotein convertase family protein